MKSQRTFATLAVMLILAAAPAWARDDQARETFQERFDQTVKIDPNGTVILHNIAGDIKISSWAQREVQISAVKTSRAATAEEAQQNAARVEIEVLPEGSDLRIDTRYPKTSGRHFDVSVEYTVMVPQPASLKVGSVSGSIDVTDCGGAADLNSVSGNILVDGVGGRAQAQSVSGDVSISNAGAESEGKTVSGDVKVELSQGPVSAESVSGDIQVVEPADSSMTFEASSFSGTIDSDFPASGQRKSHGDNVRGSVNGGGKTVSLKTFSGRVRLSKR